MQFRKSLRLKEFDYSSENWYFVTICTKNREKLFYPRVDPRFELNTKSNVAAASSTNSGIVAAGLVPANSNEVTVKVAATNRVENILVKEIKTRYNVEIDFYVFMPDHIHFIIVLSGDHKGRSYILGEIIGGFKSLSTRAYGKTV